MLQTSEQGTAAVTVKMHSLLLVSTTSLHLSLSLFAYLPLFKHYPHENYLNVNKFMFNLIQRTLDVDCFKTATFFEQ